MPPFVVINPPELDARRHVDGIMSESFAELLEESFASQKIKTGAILTGVVVGEHHEPYGDFSIDRPEFAAQFRNKDVRDNFRLGQDVDAVSRATITMSSAVRAIRNSSRRVARALLAPPGQKP